MNTIEDILDKCLEELKQGKSLDDVLSVHPEHAEELESLLKTAQALRELPDPEISVHAKMGSMAKLAVEEHDLKVKKYRFFSKPILLRVAAAVLFFFFVGYGTVAASANALPGDLTYPIKLFTEKVRFFLTMTPEHKVELRIVYSEERMKELVKKFNNGDGVDKNVLYAMLDEAELALNSSQNLPETEKSLILTHISKLSHLQNETLLAMKDKAGPEEKEILAKCAEICAQRCGCDSVKGCGASECQGNK